MVAKALGPPLSGNGGLAAGDTGHMGVQGVQNERDAACLHAVRQIVEGVVPGLFDPDKLDFTLGECDLNDQFLEVFRRAAHRLSAPGRGILWDERIMAMVEADVIDRARCKADDLTAADAKAGGYVVRDPHEMVLEIIHVDAEGSGGWIWGSGGPPVMGAAPPNCENRHEIHAEKLGVDWDETVREVTAKTEAKIRKHMDNERTLSARAAGYREASRESLERAREAANAKKPDKASLVSASWGYIAALRGVAFSELRRSREIVAVQMLMTAPTVEEAGLGCVLSASRADCMTAWWETLCPITLEVEHLRKGAHVECGAAGFWAAAVEASGLEVERALGGDGAVLRAMGTPPAEQS